MAAKVAVLGGATTDFFEPALELFACSRGIDLVVKTLDRTLEALEHEDIELASIVGRDAVRQLARVRVPEGPPPAVRPLALSALRTPTYVVAVEGTQAGATLRPLFLGRSERFASARWSRAETRAWAEAFTAESSSGGILPLSSGWAGTTATR